MTNNHETAHAMQTQSLPNGTGGSSGGNVITRRLITYLMSQGGRPRGMVGRLTGWMMGRRCSNVQRNIWAVGLLDLQQTDRVLEIGFGPGVATEAMSRKAGHVYGLDHSEEMRRQASKRNATAIREGRVTLTLGSVTQLPSELAGPFTAILAVNSLGFWPNPVARLAELRQRLAPGGRIAIVAQPRCPGATRSTSLDAALRIEEQVRAAGCKEMRTEVLELEPPVVCVIGKVAQVVP